MTIRHSLLICYREGLFKCHIFTIYYKQVLFTTGKDYSRHYIFHLMFRISFHLYKMSLILNFCSNSHLWLHYVCVHNFKFFWATKVCILNESTCFHQEKSLHNMFSRCLVDTWGSLFFLCMIFCILCAAWQLTPTHYQNQKKEKNRLLWIQLMHEEEKTEMGAHIRPSAIN